MFLKFRKKKKKEKPVAQTLIDFPTERFEAADGDVLTLRLATVADIPGLVAIQEAVYNGYAPWVSRDFYHELKQEKDRLYLVASKRDQVVAFIALVRREQVPDLHIANIAVLPVWQGRQVGSYLINTAKAVAWEINLPKLSLEARRSNTGALALYDRLGFVVEDVIENYYIDNKEDAISMVDYLDA
ncbi:ribosomal protein S18-alanine N-acetyltransferase [Fructobacillus sp. CRL 2054]|uniref:ribosomal protein S18-alanine N-acetyltransferase n=1 Tax=Fructobacillus sp. CRL 2054 TaxID=2763007 RepID=UPI002378222B|nr:ribosomal protein S18-alanine N-acetyltransferase [Fructobacillus sp. CRL 2054]MDD9138959.1 ribosomal protein S18-alanine N-acetyltransferase [Fructobacillus sp. CRL 2054]